MSDYIFCGFYSNSVSSYLVTTQLLHCPVVHLMTVRFKKYIFLSLETVHLSEFLSVFLTLFIFSTTNLGFDVTVS